MNEKLTEKDYHNITGDWTWMSAKQLTDHINELVKKVNELEGRIKEIECKKQKLNNSDEQLLISDVSDSISFKKQFDDIDFELYNNRLEIYIGGFLKGWLENEEVQNLYNFLKKYYH